MIQNVKAFAAAFGRSRFRRGGHDRIIGSGSNEVEWRALGKRSTFNFQRSTFKGRDAPTLHLKFEPLPNVRQAKSIRSSNHPHPVCREPE
jgi:hypothetical protein